MLRMDEGFYHEEEDGDEEMKFVEVQISGDQSRLSARQGRPRMEIYMQQSDSDQDNPSRSASYCNDNQFFDDWEIQAMASNRRKEEREKILKQMSLIRYKYMEEDGHGPDDEEDKEDIDNDEGDDFDQEDEFLRNTNTFNNLSKSARQNRKVQIFKNLIRDEEEKKEGDPQRTDSD